MTMQRTWRTTAQQQMEAYGLTRGEQRIAWALLQAKTNEELSAELGLTPQTVKNHLTRMLKKTGTRHRLGLVLTLLQVTDDATPPAPPILLPTEPSPAAALRRSA